MTLTYEQLMSWSASGVEAAAEEVSNQIRRKLLNQQDEIDASRVPGSWHGEAALRAQQRFAKVRDGLNDLAANVSPIVEAGQTFAGEVKSTQHAAQAAHDEIGKKQLNGHHWTVVSASSDGVQTKAPTLKVGDGDDADGTQADVDRIQGEVDGLAHDLAAAIARALQADNDFANVLNSAAKEQYDGGSGTISSAGLPPELRGLSKSELAKRILDDPARYDGYVDDLTSDQKHEVGDLLGHRLDGMDTIGSVADRKRAQQWADFLNRHGTDEDISKGVLGALGPDGVKDLIHRMTSWNGNTSVPGLDYAQRENPPVDIGAENRALQTLENSVAGGLAGTLGAATRNHWVSSNDWADGLGEDWQASNILLGAAEQHHVAFGGDFTGRIGADLVRLEGNDPQRFADASGSSFGGHSLDGADGDALRQLVRVADNSHESAQGLMMNHHVAGYLMHDRLTADQLTGDMEKVLRTATVDSAADPGVSGKNAADIASWTIHYAAGLKEPLDHHYDEEIGGIIGTYIGDAVATIDDDSYPIDPPVPPHHANFSTDDLREVLHRVGANKTAASIIGEQTSKLNQLIMDNGAHESLVGRLAGHADFHPDTPSDPLIRSVNRAAGIRGFFEDELSQALVERGEHTEVARTKTAELFTLPLDLVPVDKAGPVGALAGGYLLDGLKQHIIDGYVGDPVHSAAVEGNDNYESARRSTEVQALYSVATAEAGASGHHGSLPPELTTKPDGTVGYHSKVFDDWPRDREGNLLPPGALSTDQVDKIIAKHQYDTGIDSAVTGSVKTAWQEYQAAKGSQGK